MALTFELFYQFSGIDPQEVAGLNGNLYVGTSDSFPSEGVKEIVSLAAPVSHSTFGGTPHSRPRYLTAYNGVLYVAAPNDSWPQIFTLTSGGYTAWTANLPTIDPTWPGGYQFDFRPVDGTCWVGNSSRDLMMLTSAGVWAGLGSAYWGNVTGTSLVQGGLAWGDNDLLYIVNENSVWTFDPVSETSGELVDLTPLSGSNGVIDVAIANDRLYALSQDNTLDGSAAVISCAMDGSDALIEVTDPTFVFFPRSITAIDGALYLGDSGNDCIWKIQLPITPPSYVDPGPSSVRSHRYGRR
jgi:hypothetical protein